MINHPEIKFLLLHTIYYIIIYWRKIYGFILCSPHNIIIHNITNTSISRTINSQRDALTFINKIFNLHFLK